MESLKKTNLWASVVLALKILRLSLRSAAENKASLLNMGALVFVCLVVLELVFPYGVSGEDDYWLADFGTDIINVFVSLIIFSMFLVYGHRCVLLPQQQPKGWFVMRISSVEWRFAWLSFVIGLLFVPLLLVIFVTVFLISSSDLGADALGALQSSEEQTSLWLVAYIFFLYSLAALLFSRVGLSAPLVVLGFDRPIERAWRLSKQHKVTLFVLIAIPAALPIGFEELIHLAATAFEVTVNGHNLSELLLNTGLGLLFYVYAAMTLSHSYLEFTRTTNAAEAIAQD